MADWDRQPDEAQRAYSKFCVYRDLGSERSATKVGEICNLSASRIEKLCDQHNWVARCDQWDAHIRSMHDRAFLTEVAARGRKRAKSFEGLMAKAVAALNGLDLQKCRLSEIAAAMKVASEGMRLEDGLATAHIEMEVTDARVILSRLPAGIRSPLLRALSSNANAGADSGDDRAIPAGMGDPEREGDAA